MIFLQIAANSINSVSAGAQNVLAGNFGILLMGIGLVVAAVLVFTFLKKLIVNSILGLVAWAIAVYILKIQLPFWLSLIASAIFGLAGVGVMLLLKFAGVDIG